MEEGQSSTLSWWSCETIWIQVGYFLHWGEERSKSSIWGGQCAFKILKSLVKNRLCGSSWNAGVSHLNCVYCDYNHWSHVCDGGMRVDYWKGNLTFPKKELTKYLKWNYYLDLNIHNLNILFTCVGRIDIDSSKLSLDNLVVGKKMSGNTKSKLKQN